MSSSISNARDKDLPMDLAMMQIWEAQYRKLGSRASSKPRPAAQQKLPKR